VSVALTPVAIRACTLTTRGVFADFDGQRIGPHEGVRGRLQRALAKRRHLVIQVGRHLTDLRPRQRLAPRCLANRSTRRVDTARKEAVATTVTRACSAR
jgi:hypothetical protein